MDDGIYVSEESMENGQMSFETLISTGDLADNLATPNWVVVDCRFSLADTGSGARQYTEGHIPGSIYAHLDQDLSSPVVPGETGRHPLPTVDDAVHLFSSWGVTRDSQVVVLDDMGGAIAARLWWMFKWLGHDAAAVLDGGWVRWVAEGRPVSQEPPSPLRTKAQGFSPRLCPERMCSTEEIEALRLSPEHRLLDAREEVRFRGESEPIDAVAGHIPGAVSVPYAGNMGPEGTFKQASELRSRYSRILDAVPIENVVCYCGSGVTAAHDLLALAHAGFGMGRMYAGSWSEWITDPSRPVGRGD